MAYYDTINLEKGMYTITGKSFSEVLEELDPSGNYKNTEFEGLDAFQRQLKRFDIKVSGPKSDTISKFFNTTQSAALFPEYIRRVVMRSIDDNSVVSDVVASTSYIDSMDFRTIVSTMDPANLALTYTAEGATIPEITLKLKDRLVKLAKKGRTIVSSYEALKFQKIDAFSTILKQIGDYIAISAFYDCIDVIVDASDEGNDEIKSINLADKTKGVTYEDLVNLYQKMYPYKMNTLVVTLDTLKTILMMSEMRDGSSGLNFHGTGNIVTPLGAKIIPYYQGTGMLMALDKRYAVEMLKAGDVQVEHDKLIDRQLDRTVITSIYGFSKLSHDAAIEVLTSE